MRYNALLFLSILLSCVTENTREKESPQEQIEIDSIVIDNTANFLDTNYLAEEKVSRAEYTEKPEIFEHQSADKIECDEFKKITLKYFSIGSDSFYNQWNGSLEDFREFSERAECFIDSEFSKVEKILGDKWFISNKNQPHFKSYPLLFKSPHINSSRGYTIEETWIQFEQNEKTGLIESVDKLIMEKLNPIND